MNIAYHYKHFFNISNENSFCWMHNETGVNSPGSNISDNFEAINYLPKWFPTAGRAVSNVVCYTGFILNFLIALVLLKNRHLRKEGLTPCIVSLTLANIILYTCGIGYKLSKHVISPKTQTRCQTYGMITFITMLCSAINLFGIAALRCVKFNFSTKFENGTFQKASILTAIISWAAAFLILMPTATGNWGQFGWECKSKRCRFINYNSDGTLQTTAPEKLYYGLLISIGIFNLVMNLGTYIKVKIDCNKTASDIEMFDLDAAQRVLEKEKKVTKMLVVDSAQYLALFLPKAILQLKDPNSPNNQPLTHLIFFTIWYISGLIEALVILLFQRKYRKEIWATLQSICPCTKKESNSIDATISRRKTFESRNKTR